MKQAGVVITFTILLFSLMVISLTSQLKQNTFALEENAKFTMLIDRIAYKFENIQDNIYDILINVGNMKFGSNENEIWFSEKLPDKSKKDIYQINFDNYAKFASRYADGLDVNINSLTIDIRDLLISPYDINYNHSKDKGKYYNQLTYTPSSLNFEGYFIDITLQNQDYEKVTEKIKRTGSENKISLDIIIRNSYKITENELHYTDIDAKDTSTIIIETSGQAPKDVEITISPTGILTVTNYNSVAIDINSGVDFGEQATEAPRIELPKNLVVVGIANEDYNIEKR